jgi:hypothetical protein
MLVYGLPRQATVRVDAIETRDEDLVRADGAYGESKSRRMEVQGWEAVMRGEAKMTRGSHCLGRNEGRLRQLLVNMHFGSYRAAAQRINSSHRSIISTLPCRWCYSRHCKLQIDVTALCLLSNLRELLHIASLRRLGGCACHLYLPALIVSRKFKQESA